MDNDRIKNSEGNLVCKFPYLRKYSEMTNISLPGATFSNLQKPQVNCLLEIEVSNFDLFCRDKSFVPFEYHCILGLGLTKTSPSRDKGPCVDITPQDIFDRILYTIGFCTIGDLSEVNRKEQINSTKNFPL